MKRMSDETLEKTIDLATAECSSISIFPTSDNSVIQHLTFSCATSNLVIVELLTRLVEKDQPTCKCGNVPDNDDLPAKIIEVLDLAEALLKNPTADKLNGYARQDNLLRFGSLSQQLRSELANREKKRKG